MLKALLDTILSNLLNSNVVFSNEIQFQFYLAQELKSDSSVGDVLFEVPSFSSKWQVIKNNLKSISRKDKQYTDLVVCLKNGKYVAIELKYKTPNKAYIYPCVNGDVLTMAQGAYDLGAYSFLKDVERLTNIFYKKRYFVNDIIIDEAYAIFLTNDFNYRDNFLVGGSGVWKEFAINDGRAIPNNFLKKPDNYKKLKSLDLSNLKTKGVFDWQPKMATTNNPPNFTYVIVEIK